MTICDPRGEISFDENERNDYVFMFIEAMNQDAEEDVIANEVYQLHLQIRAQHDLYIAVKDALGLPYGPAIRKYVEIHECSLRR